MSEETKEQVNVLALDLAKLSKLVLKDMNNDKNSSPILRKYSKEQIAKFIQNPQRFERELREVSRYLYNASSHYRRTINYFANMLTFDYIVEPYGLPNKVDVDRLKRQYQRTTDFVEVMNFKHEFNKILKIAFREDVVYGYEHRTKDSYFTQILDPDYCKITSIEDGIYNYSFDFSYFDNNKDKLNNFPNEFKDKYKIYNKNKTNKWIELDSINTFCLKVNEDIEYAIPPFSSVFESVFDLAEYKDLKKIKAKIDNIAIVTQQIPIYDKSDDPNQFLIDLDTAIDFHNKVSRALPDEIGLATSPMKLDIINFSKERADDDKVGQAERDYYNAAGVSQVLFNTDNPTSVGLNRSIMVDEQIVFSVLRQLERWVNKRLKEFTTTYKFRVKFLDVTYFNKENVIENYIKLGQYGMPVRLILGSMVGSSPSSIDNLTYLENEVLGLPDRLIPLKSSHTQSDNEGGAPEKGEDELTESGEKVRDGDTNLRE